MKKWLIGFLSLIWFMVSAQDKVTVALPLFQIADHQDCLNGFTLATEEINAAGGIAGKNLEFIVIDTDIVSPEGIQKGFQAAVEAKVQAIVEPFVFVRMPAADIAASYGAPYLTGDTSNELVENILANPEKYSNVFHMDAPEIWYGKGLPKFLDQLEASGVWTPKNNKVHIIQEQIQYTQVISQATQEAIKETNGKWEVAAITDIQAPVNDWSSVIRDIQDVDAGVVMVDHWIAAELAAFAQQYSADPNPGSLVYLQYGPSQPEFLELAGPAAEGFIWSTVLGTYNDEQGATFRQKYMERFPGVMGLAYTGMCYDAAYMLKNAWEATGDPNDFKAVNDHIRSTPYRGVTGWYNLDDNVSNTYPGQTDNFEDAQAQLYVQVQGGEHKIIAPEIVKESDFVPAPWMQ